MEKHTFKKGDKVSNETIYGLTGTIAGFLKVQGVECAEIRADLNNNRYIIPLKSLTETII